MTDAISSRSAVDLFSDPAGDTPPWFKPNTFLSPEFDPESYISDLRTFVPFHTLRAELQSHLASLNRELVDLINRDYADFVNLSTKLVDVDSAVLRMRAPLLELRDKILAFRAVVETSLVALTNGLRQRSEAAAARDVLELLLDSFHVVSKVEKLIKELPSVSMDSSGGDMHHNLGNPLTNGIALQSVENGVTSRETQSVLLERIASEMNRLKFYTAHAQNLPFIENMEKRILNTSGLLNSSLARCFVDGLECQDENVIFNCLRAYAAIDNTSSPEEIFRTTLVSPVIMRIFSKGSSGIVSGSSFEELEQNYEDIMRFINEECQFLLRIAFKENAGLHVFDFLGNAILKEVLLAIQEVKPRAFSPGRPSQFLKNYRSSLAFITFLEGCCPSRSAVSKFRGGSVYGDFMKQWNIVAYFSLRFQNIAGALDSALTSTNLSLVQTSDTTDNYLLTLKQSITLMESMKTCWSEDVFIISLSDKFLGLSLQLLSRYLTWVSNGLASRKTGSAVTSSGCEWAITSTPDDFALIIHDLNSLHEALHGSYIGRIVDLLASCSPEILDHVKEVIKQGAKSLRDLIPAVVSTIIEVLVDKAVEELRQLKGITATYRMTNKPLPVRHSPYVSGVLRSLKAFLDGERSTKFLNEETRNELLNGAANEITSRYYDLAAELVSVARKTESSLQRIRQGAQRRVGASSDVSDNSVSDTDKICMQLFLDIQEYGRNLAGMGVDATKIPSFCSLWQCVAPPDRQSTIVF